MPVRLSDVPRELLECRETSSSFQVVKFLSNFFSVTAIDCQ